MGDKASAYAAGGNTVSVSLVSQGYLPAQTTVPQPYGPNLAIPRFLAPSAYENPPDSDIVAYSLLLNQPIPSRAGYTGVAPSSELGVVPNLNVARGLAADSYTVGIPLLDPTLERMAVQAAIWNVTSRMPLDTHTVSNSVVLSRALYLSANESQISLTTSMPTTMGLSAQTTRHLDEEVIAATLVDGDGSPQSDQLLKFSFPDAPPGQIKDRVALTDLHGQSSVPFGVPDQTSPATITWDGTWAAGTLLDSDSKPDTPIVLGQQVPVSTETSVQVSPVGTAHLVSNTIDDGWSYLSAEGQLGLCVGTGVLLIVLLLHYAGGGLVKFLTKGALPVVLLAAAVVGAAILRVESSYAQPIAALHAPIGGYMPIPLAGEPQVSSIYANDASRYSGRSMVDGSPRTAWVSAAGDACCDRVLLTFSAPYWIDSIVLRNGFQLNVDTWSTNGRAVSIRLIGDGGVVEDVTATRANDAEYWNSPDSLLVPVPILTRELVLEILHYTPGLHNVALSELGVEGVVASPTDRALDLRRTTPPGASDIQPASF